MGCGLGWGWAGTGVVAGTEVVSNVSGCTHPSVLLFNTRTPASHPVDGINFLPGPVAIGSVETRLLCVSGALGTMVESGDPLEC